MAINDLYSKEKLDRLKKLKGQTQGKGEIDPNLVDMEMAEQNVINKQPVQGSDDPNAPLENEAVVMMDEQAADKFLTLPPEEQEKQYNSLSPIMQNLVDERRVAEATIAEKTPGNVPYSEGLLPEGTKLPGNVPYINQMAPEGTVSFKPTPTPSVSQDPQLAQQQTLVKPAPDEFRQSIDLGLKGIQDLAKAQAIENDLKAQKIVEQEKLLTANIQAEEAIRKKDEDELLQKQGLRDEARKKQLAWKLEQGRIFKNQSTNQRVQTGIGLFLGALSNAFTGQKDVSKNPAVMAIDKAIENDIKSQELELVQLKDYANMTNNDLAEIMQTQKDRRLARLELFGRMNLLVGMTAEKQILKNDTLKSNAMANQFAADYKQKGLTALAQRDLLEAQILEKKAKARAATAAVNTEDPVMTAIYTKVPEKQRTAAIAEKKAMEEFNDTFNNSNTIINRLSKYDVWGGNIPSAIGGNSSEYKADKAALSAAIIMRVPGIRSDADFVRVVEPMLPVPSDPPDTAASKKLRFQQWLYSQRPQAPILNSIGMESFVGDPTEKEKKRKFSGFSGGF